MTKRKATKPDPAEFENLYETVRRELHRGELIESRRLGDWQQCGEHIPDSVVRELVRRHDGRKSEGKVIPDTPAEFKKREGERESAMEFNRRSRLDRWKKSLRDAQATGNEGAVDLALEEICRESMSLGSIRDENQGQ